MSNEKSLTPEKLKTFKGLENLTEEQAAYYCEQIENFASILMLAFPLDELRKELNDKENENDLTK